MSEDTMLVKKLDPAIEEGFDGVFYLPAVVKVDGKTFETELNFETFDEAYDFYTHWWRSDVVELKEGLSE